MGINQYMTRRKKIYLLIGFITLVLSIICWFFILNTGSSLMNGEITLTNYVNRWWVFSILAMLFFPVSVFAFINSFSNEPKHMRIGIALVLIALSIALCILAAIIIPGRVLDYYAPNRINENLELIYVAILITSGLIIGFSVASQTKLFGSFIRYDKTNISSTDDSKQTSTPKKSAKYSYLEEYKAKMKEGQQ